MTNTAEVVGRDVGERRAGGGSGALSGIAAVGLPHEKTREFKPRPRDTVLDAWKKGVVPEAPPSQEHLIPPISTDDETLLDGLPDFTGEDGLSLLDANHSSEQEDAVTSSDRQHDQVDSVGVAL